MFSAACLLISAGILFYVLKYRVHIHVTYTPTNIARSRSRVDRENQRVPDEMGTARQDARTRRRSPGVERSIRVADSGNAAHPELADIASALQNLGCSRVVAKQSAQRATQESQDFDSALKLAIRYATEGRAA